ncbi:fructosamine kinase family protein [Novipirellula aureliae]|nr:fructosamine kinase family protein [Novipirellula aureliae]
MHDPCKRRLSYSPSVWPPQAASPPTTFTIDFLRQMKQTVQLALRELLDPSLVVVRTASLGGGCISQAMRVEIDPHSCSMSGNKTSGKKSIPATVFLKRNKPGFLPNFQCEHNGLIALAHSDWIKIPQPIAIGVSQQSSWLVTEWVCSSDFTSDGLSANEFYSRFGASLAKMHRATAGTRIGFSEDNFLGTTRQINTRNTENWIDFVAENRIGFQLRWAVDQNLADASLKQDCETILRGLDRLLEGRRGETSLLHGDLWSGNYLCGRDGEVVFIDPAVYHGCHEAEFGMIKLFGSCPESFYIAYQQTWPSDDWMSDGWQRRTNVYVLYHLLNHMNMFGRGYAGQCRRLASELAGVL